MKKLLLPLLATAALAVPAAASAHHNWWHHHALLAKVTGTGTSFAGSSATVNGTAAGNTSLGTGTFAATITTDWTKATTRTGTRGTLSCAPATATLTLTGASAANNGHATLTGKICKWTPTSGSVVSAFFGRGTLASAGTLAGLTGTTEKAFLLQKADGTVRGAVFAGMHSMFSAEFATREHDAANRTGHCDHH
jgi:hypothetical protein